MISWKNILILIAFFISGAYLGAYVVHNSFVVKQGYCEIIGDTAEAYIQMAQDGVPKARLVQVIDQLNHKGIDDDLIHAHHVIADAAYMASGNITVEEFKTRWVMFCLQGL